MMDTLCNNNPNRDWLFSNVQDFLDIYYLFNLCLNRIDIPYFRKKQTSWTFSSYFTFVLSIFNGTENDGHAVH